MTNPSDHACELTDQQVEEPLVTTKRPITANSGGSGTKRKTAMKKTLLTTAALIAAMAFTGYFEGPAHAIGAITPRPNCEIIPTDPADVNHPVTYQCSQTRLDGSSNPQAIKTGVKREVEPPDDCEDDDGPKK